MTRHLAHALLVLLLAGLGRLAAAVPGVGHVLVIGCDGMGALSFTETNAPVMHRLMREGSWTLNARDVMPTSSSPNWASMIAGAGPEQHGITSLLNPQTTVLAQDAAEQKMEGESDSLGLFPGFKECLTQWKYDLASQYPGRKMEFEWFRHNRQCATIWVPGNVSSIKYTPTGVDYRWYTGEAPLTGPSF